MCGGEAQAEKISGRVNVVIDAHGMNFYLAAHEISAVVQGNCTAADPTRPEVESRADAKEILIGPEVTRWSQWREVFRARRCWDNSP